jgi:hypothetical protein
MSLQQLELRSTNNTIHYVLNQEHSKDQLLNSNTLRRVLGKTLKFRPTPNIIKPKTVAYDCNLFGNRLIKTCSCLICKDFIEQAKVNSKLAGICPWKPKQFPHSADYYADHNQNYLRHLKTVGASLAASQGERPLTTKVHRII